MLSKFGILFVAMPGLKWIQLAEGGQGIVFKATWRIQEPVVVEATESSVTFFTPSVSFESPKFRDVAIKKVHL